ncbi:hypothetical protein Scep_009155 [Stephania cephalantha]|uniref:Uncharacterized protein n=1 Tax=Stephania cephalantha TaxID=152367 RepID=A0AAP0JTC8_9MAGN
MADGGNPNDLANLLAHEREMRELMETRITRQEDNVSRMLQLLQTHITQYNRDRANVAPTASSGDGSRLSQPTRDNTSRPSSGTYCTNALALWQSTKSPNGRSVELKNDREGRRSATFFEYFGDSPISLCGWPRVGFGGAVVMAGVPPRHRLTGVAVGATSPSNMAAAPKEQTDQRVGRARQWASQRVRTAAPNEPEIGARLVDASSNKRRGGAAVGEDDEKATRFARRRRGAVTPQEGAMNRHRQPARVNDVEQRRAARVADRSIPDETQQQRTMRCDFDEARRRDGLLVKKTKGVDHG